MPLPWMKMWLEALDDPKLTRMSLAERGVWWGLLMLAQKCEAGGKLISGGQGLTTDEIADALHIKSKDERLALESMISKMEERGSLTWNSGTLKVVNFEKRQRIPPSSQPEAVAKRVQEFRARKKLGKGEEIPPSESEISEKGIIQCLKGWQADEDDVPWLQGLRSEFPGFTITELKVCVDYYSGRAPPKHKGIWKNRFRNWMIKKQEFERRDKAGGKGPRTYRRGDREYSAEELRQGLE